VAPSFVDRVSGPLGHRYTKRTDHMARFLILIYGDEQQWSTMTEAECEKVDRGHVALRTAARTVGATILATHELEPSTAVTLRAAANGRLSPTDGPFAETKEQVGGFYLIEAADLDQVTALAAELYEVYAGHSAVEIRPIRTS
jgi:hypothetical protein